MNTRFPVWLILLLTLGGAWLVNQLPDMRIDLTEEKLYTLSPGTRHILHTLPQPVTLEFYFSDEGTRDMPLLRDYARRVRALLEEYQRLSRGKISLEVIDPEPFSEAEDRAVSRGVRGVRLAPGAPQVYFGLAALSDGKKATIPFFSQERQTWLEYDISQLLVQLVRDHPPHLAIYAEPDLLVQGGINPYNQQSQPPWVALESLGRFYQIRWLAKEFTQIPEGTELLLLIHPKALSEKSLYAIDQFMMADGKALIFVDPYAELDGPPAFVQPGRDKHSDLNRLFRAWGFEQTERGFVGDAHYASRVTVGNRSARHLGLLTLDRDAWEDDDPTLANLDKLVLSSAGALRPLPKANIRFDPLVQSSPDSMLIPTAALDYLFDPNMLYEAFKPGGKRFTLIARIEGKLSSAFKGKPPQGIENAEHRTHSTFTNRLIVVADTDILANRLWARLDTSPDGERLVVPFADNGAFLINAIDQLNGHPDLISIRGRGKFGRPFTVVEAMRRKARQHFQTETEGLQKRLKDTETKLAELETRSDHNQEVLTAEQRQTIEEYRAARLRIRKQLRRLQHRLNQDIERLGVRIKLIDILGVPLLLTMIVLGIRWWPRHQRHQRTS